MSAIAAFVTVSAVAALGAVSLADGATSARAAQYQYNAAKVTICHKGMVTIRVSVNALPAHRAHGDVEAACATARAAKAKAVAAAKAKAKAKAKGHAKKTTSSSRDDEDEAGNGGHGNGNGKAKGRS